MRQRRRQQQSEKVRKRSASAQPASTAMWGVAMAIGAVIATLLLLPLLSGPMAWAPWTQDALGPRLVQDPTALMKAAYLGDLAGVRLLVQQDSSTSKPMLRAQDPQGWSALNYALNGQHDHLSESVLRQQQAPDADQQGAAADANESKPQHQAVIEFLVQQGIAGHVSTCPIYYAITYRNLAAMRLLLSTQEPSELVKCLHMKDHNNVTALHLLALSKAAGFARLFKQGIDRQRQARVFEELALTPTNALAAPPIRRTVIENDATTTDDIALLAGLRAHGLHCDARDAVGRTPLHVAAFSGRSPRAIEALVTGDLACDPRAVDHDGNTPLHLAVAQGLCSTAAALLRLSSPLPTARNFAGHTAADLMQQGPFVRVCTQAGANRDAAVQGGSTDFSNAAADASAGAWQPWACDEVDARDIQSADSFLREFAHVGRPVVLRGYVARFGTPHAARLRLDALRQPASALGSLQVSAAAVPYSETYGRGKAEAVSLAAFVRGHMDLDDEKQEQGGQEEEEGEEEEEKQEQGGQEERDNKRHEEEDERDEEEKEEEKKVQSEPRMYVFDANVIFHSRELQASVGLPFFVTDPQQQLVLAQFMAGPAGSGAPPHFHGQAFNVLFQGTKEWQLFPPEHAFFHVMPAQDWFADRGVASEQTMTCTQREGDALLVPAFWGHAVLNTQPVVAVAFEFNG